MKVPGRATGLFGAPVTGSTVWSKLKLSRENNDADAPRTATLGGPKGLAIDGRVRLDEHE